MKLLALAIDGGDRRIIEKMPMPFLHRILREDQAPKLTGDLYSRGWAEIYTGKHAIESGALYMYPCLDGTHRFTQSYNYKISESAGCPMLWSTLNQGGVSVGFMNIPTTSPAPTGIDGFFVGGGGGGVSKTEGIPTELCESEATRRILEEIGYIADLRLGGEALTNVYDLFDRLDAIITKRKEAFLRLCEDRRPDFGLLCFRVSTTVQYFAMSEIEVLLAAEELRELNVSGDYSDLPLSGVQKRILQHYRLLDEQIQEVFEAIEPQEYLFCADHGASRYKYNINVNEFLVQAGYQKRLPEPVVAGRRFIKKARGKLSGSFPFVRISNVGALVDLNTRHSRAFGHWYVNGIYVNDDRRFGGPVKERAGLDDLVDSIVETFNGTEEASRYSMVARPFRRLHPSSSWNDRFPDILIDKPDEMFFGRSSGFVSPNANYGPIPENITGLGDMHSGQKSRDPLFVLSPGLMRHVRDSDPTDLCLVYKIITREMIE